MEYLREYRDFYLSKEDVEKIYTPFINWNLIFDIQDMALEYIDDNFHLTVCVYINDVIELYKLNFKHGHKDTNWFKLHSNYEHPNPNRKISYSILLDTDDLKNPKRGIST